MNPAEERMMNIILDMYADMKQLRDNENALELNEAVTRWRRKCMALENRVSELEDENRALSYSLRIKTKKKAVKKKAVRRG